MSAIVRFSLVILIFSSSVCRANDMTLFLKSCAYGTLAGAALGLASLAISENPSSNISNVARGASLGLYAGIGVGLYMVYSPSQQKNSDYTELEKIDHPMWLSMQTRDDKVTGLQINWAKLNF